MIRYVTFDDAGNLTGCYVQDLQDEHKGAYIEVTEERARNWLQYQAVGGVLQLKPPSAPDATTIKAKNNDDIEAKIIALETKQARPVRGLLDAMLRNVAPAAGDVDTFNTIKTKIDALRAQLIK